MKKNPKVVRLGILGFGTVATGVVKALSSHSRMIERKTGIRLVLKRVAVKSLSKKRMVPVTRGLLTNQPSQVLSDRAIDIVIELIGGIHPAKNYLEAAFRSGKHVVTANKALLAESGSSLFEYARKHSMKLGFEASVCGGIPIVKALKEGLAANEISHFLGIVNGTCNFILSSMSRGSLEFSEALAIAQKKGYAEKNPKLDVEGVDSAHKLAILSRLAFRVDVPFKAISVEGIQKLSRIDIEYAKDLGYVVKLLAIGKKMKSGLELRVHPTLLPLDHPLSSVHGVYNAVFLHADQAGDLLFYGKGAGMSPTASAVMSDVIDIAKRITGEADLKSAFSEALPKAKVLPLGRMKSKYYLRFQVADKPGVLGRIAQTLGKNQISILSVHQKESHDPRSVPVVILTYEAMEKNIRKALALIDRSRDVKEKTIVIRVES